MLLTFHDASFICADIFMKKVIHETFLLPKEAACPSLQVHEKQLNVHAECGHSTVSHEPEEAGERNSQTPRSLSGRGAGRVARLEAALPEVPMMISTPFSSRAEGEGNPLRGGFPSPRGGEGSGDHHRPCRRGGPPSGGHRLLHNPPGLTFFIKISAQIKEASWNVSDIP